MGRIESGLVGIAQLTNEFVLNPSLENKRELWHTAPGLGTEINSFWSELPLPTQQNEKLKYRYGKLKQLLGVTSEHKEFSARLAPNDFYREQSDGWKIVDFLLRAKFKGSSKHDFIFGAYSDKFKILVPECETSVSFNLNDPNKKNPVRIDINTLNHTRENSLMFEARELVEGQKFGDPFDPKIEQEFGSKRYEITRRFLNSIQLVYQQGLVRPLSEISQNPIPVLV